MVVVVDTRNSLCIKRIYQQPPYNQNTLFPFMGLLPHGCTQVVIQKLYRTRFETYYNYNKNPRKLYNNEKFI